MVGSGFAYAYKHLQKNVTRSVKAIMDAHPYEDVSITVTGHSLGGALVHLCVMDLVRTQGIPVSKAITFGSPRTGNVQFANYYNTSRADGDIRWRVTHYKDPIVHLPPISPLAWFQHVPTEVFFNHKDGADPHHFVCDGSGEDHSCSYSKTADPSAKYHLDYLGRSLGGGSAPGEGCQP